MIAKTSISIFALQLLFCSMSMAADLTIGQITPVFDAATPGFGEFSVKVSVKNNTAQTVRLNLVCLYIGLTRPGLYYKNEPQVQKQYLTADIGPMRTESIVFKDHFRTYHPEMLGEIIVSMVGNDAVRSLKLETAFHPWSQD